MKRTLKYVALALVFAGTPAAMAEGSDCYDLSVAVTKAVSSAPSNVLEIVQLINKSQGTDWQKDNPANE